MTATRPRRIPVGSSVLQCAVTDGLSDAVAPLAVVRETPPRSPGQPKLLDRVRTAARLRHLSARTESAYSGWIRRFVVFSGLRHPREMGAAEVTRFLSSLATEAGVSASTQNQALAALLFLYREVLRQDLPWLDGLVRAETPERLPVVLSRAEVR